MMRAILLLVALLLMAACSAGPGAGSPQTLAGREFLSVSVSESGTPQPLVDGTRIRLGFEADRFTAHAGCNTLGGTYTLTAGQLLVQDLVTTEIGCDPALHEQDEWLAEFLTSKPTLGFSGDELVLEADGTVITLQDRKAAEQDLPLAGTTWTVESLMTGDVVSSVPAGAMATVTFQEDGRVDVRPGCNQGSAPYSASDGVLTIGPIALTKMACPGAGDELEQAVLHVLTTGRMAYSISTDVLTITGGGAGLQLRGNAEPTR